MRRQGNLFEQIVTFENLILASKKALRGKRSKHTASRYFFHLEKAAIILQEELVSEAYKPRPYHQFLIYEPKVRNISSSDFRDRIVHHAICRIIEPSFERRLIYDSHACRVGKGSHKALERCQGFVKKYEYFLKCDIRKYFESVNHALLKNLLKRLFKDEKLLRLLEVIIDHVPESYEPGRGIPIGNLTSQHFANLYLGELDHFLKDRLRVKGYLRYMDDCVPRTRQLMAA